MKPWGDALSGARVLLSQWLPRWLGGGPTCPTMAAMQSQQRHRLDDRHRVPHLVARTLGRIASAV